VALLPACGSKTKIVEVVVTATPKPDRHVAGRH
jgi:hypothetical protein